MYACARTRLYLHIRTHAHIGTHISHNSHTRILFISCRRSETVGLAASCRLIFAGALPLSLGWRHVKSVVVEASPGGG